MRTTCFTIQTFVADEGELEIPSKITKRLVRQWEFASNGALEGSIKSVTDLASVCRALHLVTPSEEPWGVPDCDYNPLKYECHGCKGFKQCGICAHVICVNCLLGKVDLRKRLEHNTGRHATEMRGRKRKMKPGLQRQNALPKAGEVRVKPASGMP